MLYWILLFLGLIVTGTNIVYIAYANRSPESRPPKWVFPVIPCILNCIAIIHLMPVSIARSILYWSAIILEALVDLIYPWVFRRWFNGRTRLHDAVEKGDKDRILKYLAEGDDVNAADKSGLSLLWISVKRGDAEISALLLSHGADPNIPHIANVDNPIYNQPLEYAAYTGRTDIMQLLISAGANINEMDGKGSMAIMNAISQNNEEAVKLLLDFGADVYAPTRQWGKTAVEYAKEKGGQDIINIIKEYDRN